MIGVNELIKETGKKTGAGYHYTKEILNKYFEVAINQITKGNRVRIGNLVTLEKVRGTKKHCTTVNPKGDKVKVVPMKPYNRIKVRVCEGLKKLVK